MKKLLLLLVFISVYANAQIVNIPDPVFKAKLLSANLGNNVASLQSPYFYQPSPTGYNSFTYQSNSGDVIDVNGNGEIEVSEAQSVKYLNLIGANISNLTGIEYFINLEALKVWNSSVSSFNTGNLTHLKQLEFSGNSLNVDLDLTNNTQLELLKCYGSNISSLNISSLSLLKVLNCSSNFIDNLNANNLDSLLSLQCGDNPNINDLTINGLNNLRELYCNSMSGLTTLTITNCSALNNFTLQNNGALQNFTLNSLPSLINVEIQFGNNSLQNLDLSNIISLTSLSVSNSNLISLNLNNLVNLEGLEIVYCPILSNLTIDNLQHLTYASIRYNNSLASLNITNCNSLGQLYCDNNILNNLLIDSCPSLLLLECSYNNLSNIVGDLSNIQRLSISRNQFVNFNFFNLLNLKNLYCDYNQFSQLDLSNNYLIEELSCKYNVNLINLIIKGTNINGGSLTTIYFNYCDNLRYICCNEDQISYLNSIIFGAEGYGNYNINTYCSFTPGGTFYTINGTNRYDENNNGCDTGDMGYPNLKINITNGTNSGSILANTTGNYTIPVQAGTHTLTPQLENPSYFNVSPATTSITFTTQTSPFTQDFCITPNGVHKDVEITLIPTSAARPGFPAQYKLIYKNKGNSTVDGTIAVNFSANPDVMHFQSAVPNVTSQSATELSWDYTALQPFEIREIDFTMLLNTPMATPPLNGGDYLGIDADITPVIDDENYIDNHSELKQLVVNSNDPNDKTCLEGQTISNSMIGQYVHYMIRFENTGTYPAQNIVVKDIIDTTKFDVSTLQMTRASHDCYTRINGNKVEFIFENINLPFDDATNDGYVVFKIKTKSTLAQNSSVSNTADIFFDYNFPITTNTATTNFANLATQNAEKVKVSVYPNPAKNVVNIKSENQINSVTVFDIQGRQVQTKIVGATETVLDINALQQGNYLLKINTDKGVVSEKIIKE